MRALLAITIIAMVGLALAPTVTASALDIDAEARPPLIEVYPCFRPGTYYIVIAGTVATGCIGVAGLDDAQMQAAIPDPIAIYPCFRPGTFHVVIFGQSTGCIGLPPA